MNKSLADYEHMLLYPKNIDRLQKSLTPEKFYDKVIELRKVDVYGTRNTLIDNCINGDTPVKDTTTIWDFEKEIL